MTINNEKQIIMTNIYTLTQQYVENYELNNHKWFVFANKCSQEEFLKSQEGFYYAVRAFPRMLSKLATDIKTSEARKLIIDNLFEEHGLGNKNDFHTNTYYNYLLSLGFDNSIDQIKEQPWINDWINLVLNKNYSEEHFSMYLAGIEYIYAKISYFITHLISKFDLRHEQNHYKKHSELDYEHAKELIQTSLMIQQYNGTVHDDEMMHYFILGISEFLQLYEKMILLTKIDATLISKEKLAFYYGREDVTVNYDILNTFHTQNNKKAEVLMICSGGENVIELLSMTKPNNFVLLDINPYQLDLTQQKIQAIKNNDYLYSTLNTFNTGKFEKLFQFFKNSFTYQELLNIAHSDPQALQKLKCICDNVFSNQILEIVFTDNATKFSKDSFSLHFYNVFKKQIKNYFEYQYLHSNIGSILFNHTPINYSKQINPENNLNYFNGSFLQYFDSYQHTFDLIDVSNISDWMPIEDMKIIILKLFSQLNKNGFIVARKLLGNYQWKEIQQILPNSQLSYVHDKTDFYSECVLIKKL